MNLQVIHRYKINSTGLNEVAMPADAEIKAAVPSTTGGLSLYAQHAMPEDGDTLPTRHIAILKTGVPFPAGGRWVATFYGGVQLIEFTAEQAAEYLELYPNLD